MDLLAPLLPEASPNDLIIDSSWPRSRAASAPARTRHARTPRSRKASCSRQGTAPAAAAAASHPHAAASRQRGTGRGGARVSGPREARQIGSIARTRGRESGKPPACRQEATLGRAQFPSGSLPWQTGRARGRRRGEPRAARTRQTHARILARTGSPS
eukprot:scaffold260048_cov31-Tisochrysis_lutea.AAC.3